MITGNKKILSLLKTHIPQNIFFILFIILLAVEMFLLNYYHPLYLDDWAYSFVVEDYATLYNSPRLESFSEVFVSQYNHYMTWGGRVVAHFIAQTLLLMPPWLHNLLNTLVYIGFILLIYRIVNFDRKRNVYVLLFVALMMWFSQPVFPETTVWLTGSSNYLWCTFIILLFIFPYYKLYRSGSVKMKDSTSMAALYLLFGIAAGWTNENMSAMLIVFIIAMLFFLKKEKIAIPKWAYAGLIGVVIGAAFLVLAPGNIIRLEFENEFLQIKDQSFREIIEYRIHLLFKTYLKYIIGISAVYICMLIVGWILIEKQKREQIFFLSLFFFIAAHIAFFVMIATPKFPARATFGVITFLIISIGILYANIELKNLFLKISNIFVLLLFIAYYQFYSYNIIYSYTKYMTEFWERREQFIEMNKRQGNYDVEFIEEMNGHQKFNTYEIDEDPELWFNKVYARFYGLKSARINRDDKNEHPTDQHTTK